MAHPQSLLAALGTILAMLHLTSSHSIMTIPQGISSETCRLGGDSVTLNCAGPCDFSATDRPEGSKFAHFFPPNPASAAATYERGEQIEISMTRNNHPGGGFVRLTLVPLEKVKDKAVHAANAFHYSCWGSNIVVASGDALNPPDKYGYSMVGSDGQTHSHPKAYYKTSAEIPDVVPDGSYMLGWAWFGGVTGGVKGNFVQEPTHWSYFADYWSCSFVAVKGGKPLASSYTPKFINDMSQFSSDGCMAHANDIGLCTYEPCLDRKSFYQKPAAFNGSGPKPITPENFGGEVPPVDEVPKETPKADPPRETPTTEPPNETPTVEPPKETPTVELPKETPKAEDPVYTDPPTENPDPVYFDRGLMSCLCIAGSSDMCFKELASYTDNCDAHERYYRQPSGCAESCCAFCKKTGDKFSACRNANTQRACSGN